MKGNIVVCYFMNMYTVNSESILNTLTVQCINVHAEKLKSRYFQWQQDQDSLGTQTYYFNWI